MTDVTVQESANAAKNKMQLAADEAKEKAEKERRRSLEAKSSFYDKLSALNAGSIAVTVSIGSALLGKSDGHFGSLHSHLSWLLSIAGLFWLSLICSVSHNTYILNVTLLEAAAAEAWADYRSLLAVQFLSSGEVAEVTTKMLTDTFHQRIQDGAMNTHRTQQDVYRAVCLGRIAVWTFLTAYTVVVVAVVHLWWATR